MIKNVSQICPSLHGVIRDVQGTINMNEEKREKLDKDAEELFAKMNKADANAMDEFKLGVGFIDKPVKKIDSGVRKISEKVHGLVDRK
jgi:hypothetical protein